MHRVLPVSLPNGLLMASQSRKLRRQYRSLAIGFLALLAIVWGLVYLLEVPGEAVLALLLGSVLLVAGFALAAFIVVLLVHLLKRMTGKR